MDLVVTTIAIAFVPLLEKICNVLAINKHIYKQSAAWLNMIEVMIESSATGARHIFEGDDGPTLQASAECAAMKAAVFLVQRFKVVVVDINLDVRARHERATQFFACKQDWYAKMDQGTYKLPNYEVTPTEGIHYSTYRVELDFLDLLTKVVQTFAVPFTPIHVMQLRPGIYLASTSIGVPATACKEYTFTGYEAQTMDDAKQTLAKEVISFLAYLYRFEVVDINYHFLRVEAAILKAQRNSCVQMKERVDGLLEEQEPCPNIVELDQMTPKGKRARILVPIDMPSPSKKHCSSGASSSAQHMIPDAIITPELKFLDKRPRHD